MVISMPEKRVEKAFKDGVASLGCDCVKYRNPARVGGPDRLVLIPGGIAVFIELKDLGETPRPDQVRHMISLCRLGFLAMWFDNAEKAIESIEAVINGKYSRQGMLQLCTRQAEILERLF